MKLSQLVSIALAAAAAAASAQAPAGRLAVEVRLTGDDGLTNRLREGLEDGIRKSNRLKLVGEGLKPALIIRSESNVEWDKLGGRTVVIYNVQIGPPDDAPSHIGICFQTDMQKCVRDILRIASLAVSSR